MADWVGFLNILKQYGPLVGLLLFFIYWQWRQIQSLLDRNATIYQAHIQNLQETQDRLLTKLIGPRLSSQSSPTIKEIQTTVENTGPTPDAPNGERQ